MLFSLAACKNDGMISEPVSEKDKPNNAYTNNLNAGLAVSDGEYLYYIGFGDSKLTVKRVRLNDIQGESEVVFEGAACNLFLSNDKALYFASENGITCVEIDNRSSAVLLEYYDAEECGITLQGEWIYSAYGFDGAGDDNFDGISRINISTKVIEQVFNGEEIGINAKLFSVVGDMIYFEGSNGKTEGIFSVSTNGGNPSLFYETEPTLFSVTDDFLISSTSDGDIWAVPLSGSTPRLVHKTNGRLSSLNAFKENIYYVLEGSLFCIRINDGVQEKIIDAANWDGNIGFVNIAGGKLVFLFQSSGGSYESGIYCADLDGNNAFRLD